MTSRKTIRLALMTFALILAAFGSFVPTPTTLAQDRRSERENDDDERGESDRRSDSYRRWRERSRDRGDRDRDESSSERESNDRGSNDRSTTDRGSGNDQSMATTDYAKSLVKQHDKNGNMMLEGDEVKQLRGRAALADANNDNVVTVDELVARLSGPSSSASGSTNTTTSSSSSNDDKESEDREGDRDRDRGSFFGVGRDRDRSSASDRSEDSKSGTIKRVYTGTVGVGKAGDDAKSTRRTYRFTPAGDLLPTGLPDWFKSRDKNGDGQVQMSEYTRSWSSRMVAEFRRYDLNDDGVITSKEATKK
jgi:EF hand domain-containing protein